MHSFRHLVSTNYEPTFRTEKVAGLFDVQVKDKLTKSWKVDIPIDEKDWSIGLIVGASGSGKTILSEKIFGQKAYHHGFDWNSSNILDDFDESLSVTDIVTSLSHVGFSSPPSWLLPYSALSNGQKFRAEIARAIIEKESPIVFDEFTSVVDRTVAKIGSHAVQKFIRASGKQFVAVSCHYDIEEWLQPDWVYDVSLNEFKWGSLRRSGTEAKIFQCNYKAWKLFEGHHYLSANINKASTVFVVMIENEPAAMCAILPFPHPKKKNFWRGHRTVVLPDYQGIGLGNRLSEFCGEWLKEKGKGYISTTSHPSMIKHRIKSDKWVMTRKSSRTVPASRAGILAGTTSHKRLTSSFQYVG